MGLGMRKFDSYFRDKSVTFLGATKVHCRHMKSITFSCKMSKMVHKMVIKEKETQYHWPLKICFCFIFMYRVRDVY